jgi:hypothetical protein
LSKEHKVANKGEGSRGGHIIGHTKSGAPIYGSAADHAAKIKGGKKFKSYEVEPEKDPDHRGYLQQKPTKNDSGKIYDRPPLSTEELKKFGKAVSGNSAKKNAGSAALVGAGLATSAVAGKLAANHVHEAAHTHNALRNVEAIIGQGKAIDLRALESKLSHRAFKIRSLGGAVAASLVATGVYKAGGDETSKGKKAAEAAGAAVATFALNGLYSRALGAGRAQAVAYAIKRFKRK